MPPDQVLAAEEPKGFAQRAVQRGSHHAARFEADEEARAAEDSSGHQVVAERRLPGPLEIEAIERRAADGPGAAPDQTVGPAARQRHHRSS